MYRVKNHSTNSVVYDPDTRPIPPGKVKPLSEAEYHSESVQFLMTHGILRDAPPEAPTRVEAVPPVAEELVVVEMASKPKVATKPKAAPKRRRSRKKKVEADVDNPTDP